ncbi:metalloregulator ArsR/SmtB family transcription factor [Maridesulfovibrio bastinii]|uniref:metalloregulator ArsR/SmtB family transcription factor n=1 Tax=Maridesulfovibrio bastinii TaxID=47157 RepID=UPI00040FB92A|nr:metalloregulator ArsR/SmtB family transcription factor [Maridesulfovibrio bastinii]
MPRTVAKSQLNEVFATVAKGLAHANRVELVELLSQGERDVDSLAQASNMSVANTSHHLKILRQCGLIYSRQEGQRVIYFLSDNKVISLMIHLHHVAIKNLPELNRLLSETLPSNAPLENIAAEKFDELVSSENILIFDLRPQTEYDSGHIPGAVSATTDSIKDIPDCSDKKMCAVYCRSTFCPSPYIAAGILAEKGYRVFNLEGGFPAWRLAGNEITVTLKN